MRFSTKKVVLAMLVLGAILAMSTAAAAQLNSGAQTVTLNATMAESLTLNLSAGLVNFTLVPGSASNPGSTSITANTAWVLKPGRTAVTVNAYFSSANALTDGAAGDIIPTSAFTIANNLGAPTPLTGAHAYGGNGYRMENISITGTNKIGSVTDVMVFNIDLSPVALAQLPAGTYTGVLNIQAQATP